MTAEKRGVRTRYIAWGAVAVAAVTAIAVLPVFGSSHPDADRLRLTDDVQAFFYGSVDPATATDVQHVTVSKDCQITPLSGGGPSDTGDPLVSLSANTGGPIKGPGTFDLGIGVKSGGSNGTPCKENSGAEVLSIASFNSWISARLDVEVKGGVWVIAELWADGVVLETHELLTGSSIDVYNAANPGDPKSPTAGPPYYATTTATDPIAACADPNDSGPDANVKDQCLWTIAADAPFDELVMYAKNDAQYSGGSVSLEGGADYEAMDPAGFAAGNFDTLFYRALSPQDDAYVTDEDTALDVGAPGVLSNDGTEGATVSLVSSDDVGDGSLTVNSDGSFSYVPATDFNGEFQFTYNADNGSVDANADVTITVNPVNDAPVPVPGPLPGGGEDPLPGEEVVYTGEDLATDVDIDDTLTVVSASAANGDVVVNGGTATYTPDPDFCGIDTLTFEVQDDGTPTGSTDDPVTGQDATVTIIVLCAADNDSYEMDERIETEDDTIQAATLDVAAPGVLDNDGDVPGDLTAALVSGPNASDGGTGGTLNLNGNGSFDFEPDIRTPQEWGDNDSYDVTFTYQTTYPDQDPQTALVTITVNRNLCQEDTVTDTDGDVTAEITLLYAEGCKPWTDVTANGVDKTVLFQPDADGTLGVYDAKLIFRNSTLEDAVLDEVILKYDTDPDDGIENFIPVPSCATDDDGEPIQPGGAITGWCFYASSQELTGTDPITGKSLFTFTWCLRGDDDPLFKNR